MKLLSNTITIISTFFINTKNIRSLVIFIVRSKSISLPILALSILFMVKPLNAQATEPQPDDIEIMLLVEHALSNLSSTMSDFFFLNSAPIIPQAAAISSYGANKISFIAPNPYFHLQVNGGMTVIFPLVNVKALDFDKEISNIEDSGLNLGPLAYIANRNTGIALGMPVNIIHFGARFQILSMSPILDRFDFGISYATPHIPLNAIDKIFGILFGFDFNYSNKLELYGASVRYRVFENNITSLAIGGSFNYISHALTVNQEQDGMDITQFRRIRRQATTSNDIDQLYPVTAPYTLNIIYKQQSSFKASALDLFLRADFGIALFKPFIDFGLTIKTSERLVQSAYFSTTLFEDSTINPSGNVAANDNVIMLRNYRYSYRPSGISAVTPRFSVGFNALHVLNFRFSFTMLRAEIFVPSFALATTLNLDF